LYGKAAMVDVEVIASLAALVVSLEEIMAEKPCERCRMIRFYVVWTILMTVFTLYYLDSPG
jgi:disulfide bond formation protein DsbB